MKKLLLLSIGLPALVACGGVADQGDQVPAEQTAALHSSSVIPAAEPVLGRSQSQWGARFWQQLLPYPANRNPILDQTGAFGDVGQFGPVWFLSGPVVPIGSPTATKHYTVPAGKTLYVPILNFVNDYPCPDPSYKPAPGQSLEDFLQQGAAATIDLVTSPSADVDGAAVADVQHHRHLSDLFFFRGDLSLRDVGFDACINGKVQPGVNDGYAFMVRPLPRGEHTVRVRGSILPFGVEVKTDFHLTVR